MVGVRVRIDEPWDDGLALRVDHRRPRGHVHVGPHGDDPVALDDERAVLDDLVAVHRDQPRANEGDGAREHVRLHRQADGQARRVGRRNLVGRAIDEGKAVVQIAREVFRPDHPMQPLAVAGPVEVDSGVARDFLDGDGLGVFVEFNGAARPGNGAT